MREDIILTPTLQSFLEFDLGQLDESKFLNKVYDVKYSCKNLTLDIYYPQMGRVLYPVFLIIYGGGWVSGHSRTMFVEPMLKPLEYGYACVVANYTLALDAAYPQALIDLQNVLGWIKQDGESYKLDSSNVNIWGESAGGHLCLMLGLLPRFNECEYSELSVVKNMISFYPLTNSLSAAGQMSRIKDQLNGPIMENSGELFDLFLGSECCCDEQKIKEALPVYNIHPDMPPLFLQHGDQDTILPYDQSIEFMNGYLKYGSNHYFEIAKDKQHTDPYFFSDENIDKMIKFVEGKL